MNIRSLFINVIVWVSSLPFTSKYSTLPERISNCFWNACLCSMFTQGRRKRGGRGGLSRPTFLGNLNYELVHSVESAIEDKRVDSLWQCSRSRCMLSEVATAVCSFNAARC